MNTKIKIFLASSSELEEDRRHFEILINRKNKQWVDRGIFLDLVIWEDFLDALSKTRLQDEYNKAIKDCDIFVMLFCTKVGKYTEEEFETAFGQFKDTDKPVIFTYFKDAKISTATTSAIKDDLKTLWAFQKKLQKLNHFQTVYENVDRLALHFYQQLDKLAEKGIINLIDGPQTKALERIEIINEIDYVPKKPEDSFLLRYLWLDATTSSFLIAGRFDPGLARLLPANPVVIHNPVFRKLRDIVNRFGHLEGLKTDPNLSGVMYTLKTSNDLIDIDGKWRDPSEARNKLRIYAAEEDIIWPDEPALRAIFKTTEWPRDYNMTYEEPFDWRAWQEPDDNVDFQNVTISCVRLHARISVEKLTNYWTSMKELENAISLNEFKHADVTNTMFYDLTHDKINTVRNKSIDAMLYFGELGWPEDFLFAFGNASIGGCGQGAEYDYRFGFYAKPRKLFTLVAVIEPRQNDLQIEGVRYSVDSREQLRELQEGGEPQDSPPGVVTIKKAEMAVIPLRIELRYDLDDYELRGMTDAVAAKKVHDRIKGMTPSILKFTGRETYYEGESHPPPPLQTVFSKSVSSFRLPAPLKFTPAYVFGPAFGLKTLTIRGTEVAVRSAPAAAVAYLGKAPVGSCPFLFVSNGMDDPSRVGRVLIGASRKDLARTEEIKLPKETRSFFISEQEPEVTFLETVGVKDSSSGIEQLIASSVVLHPGDAREFFIPQGFGGEVTLRLRGYYKPLRLDRFVDSGPASTSSPD
jgi:hypothetical protein